MSAQGKLFAALKVVAPTWPGIAPDEAPRNRLTYARVAGTEFATYDGDGTGAAKRRFQVDAWAETAGDARRLADAARGALYAAQIVGEITDNPDDYEKDTKLFRASFDVEVWE